MDFWGLNVPLSFYRDILITALTMILHQADSLEVCPAFLGPEVTGELSWIPSKPQALLCRLSSITSTSMDKVRGLFLVYCVHMKASAALVFGGLELRKLHAYPTFTCGSLTIRCTMYGQVTPEDS